MPRSSRKATRRANPLDKNKVRRLVEWLRSQPQVKTWLHNCQEKSANTKLHSLASCIAGKRAEGVVAILGKNMNPSLSERYLRTALGQLLGEQNRRRNEPLPLAG